MEPLHAEILVCQCGDPAHQLVVFYDDTPQNPTVYVAVHLAPERNFFKRLLRGLRYIFTNRRSVYGDFDEVMLQPKDAHKLQAAVDILNGKSLNNQHTVEIPITIEPTKYVS